MMRKTLTVLAVLLVTLPAAAQSPGRAPAAAPAPAPAVPPAVAAPAPVVREVAPIISIQTLPHISPGHAVALGTGLFVGALAGSVMIHGGALATLIGAAAGLTVGHWYWTERHDDAD